MRVFYSALYYCLLPALVLRMVWRSRRAIAYRQRLPERFGFFTGPPDDGAPAIWLHAVSVGEVVAATPLVEALLRDYPAYRVVLTTTTPTGSERVRALFGDRVFHVYVPWDLPGPLRRFLRRTRPRLLLIMETELWPNMLHYSRAAGCRCLLLNGRLSERSARGYGRFPGLSRQLLQQLDGLSCQSSIDGKRFLSLGLAPSRLSVTGSLKFDVVISPVVRAGAAALRKTLAGQGRPVLVAASTHGGEEELILAAFRAVRDSHGDCLLVLVPRHPERFGEVYSLCSQQGWQVQRRSAKTAPQVADDILLVDTMGELPLVLGIATVAFFGGSLVAHGGHNVLEAAAWGVPAVTGPHMGNFAEISRLLSEAGAMVMLGSEAELVSFLLILLGDPERCQLMGRAGLRVLEENRGALARQLALVAQQLVAET